MGQRTCSHRISELYNEIILRDKFKNEYISQHSFYQNRMYVTIFRNNGFKSKLLIVDKDNQDIIFENICGTSFLIYQKIEKDLFLFLVDFECYQIQKIKNPILNNGIATDLITERHPFIFLSKNINDILLKDDLLYFSININGLIIEEDKQISIELTKNNNYLTTVDKIVEDFIFRELTTLVGINAIDLKEIGRNNFDGNANPIKFFNKNLNRKNAVLIEVYDTYFMEPQTYFIDYGGSVAKQLHPPYLIQTSDDYLLILPFHSYNSYFDFKLIRLSDLNEVNLRQVLPEELIEHFEELDFEQYQILNDNFLFIGDYVFSCENLFNNLPNVIEKSEHKNTNIEPLMPIIGDFFKGYAMEIHTIKSALLPNGKFETTRTVLGDMVYRLKYMFDKSVIEDIAIKCSKVIQSHYHDIDIIIPVPPSNLKRPFQPVYEVAKVISKLVNIQIDLNYILKLPTEQIKSLNNPEDRSTVLDRAISIADERYKNKNILLFDDLYRSGDTLNAISKKLLIEGKVKSIKILCITKTRTKK